MPPPKPDPQRDLHTPVSIMRFVIAFFFMVFWLFVFRSGLFMNGPTTSISGPQFSWMALLLFGGPIFALSFLLAACAWEGAWTMQLATYNEAVDVWNAHHGAIEQRRREFEQEQRDAAARDQAVRQLEDELKRLHERARELSR